MSQLTMNRAILSIAKRAATTVQNSASAAPNSKLFVAGLFLFPSITHLLFMLLYNCMAILLMEGICVC